MTDKALLGIHHVTAITSSAEDNFKFITEILGMRLVKKTVNQDDIQTYHTYFADDEGNPGTVLTFFDFPGISKSQRGTNAITRTSLRVPNDAALAYYINRFDEFDVQHGAIEELFGKKIVKFEDFDGQRFQLISDENNQGVAAGIPWKKGPVPTDKAIYGLGPIEITVSYFDEFKTAMQQVFGFREVTAGENVVLLEVGEGGNGGQMILRKDNSSSDGIQGYGDVHHVSFRVTDNEALKAWEEAYNKIGIGNSGNVERHYFKALYARVGHILIELSTDGPGFMEDEPYETIGETLSLPPFLEAKREYIESAIRPFDTSRDHSAD